MTKEVMQQALEALEKTQVEGYNLPGTAIREAITALREALAQPEQEPVAFYHPRNGFYWAKPTSIFAPTVVDVPPMPLYTAPPQRPWQGLTDDDWDKVGDMPDTFDQGAAWAQARLKERNNG